ncbi:hypothetical protein GGTG_08048 [Gaeumannomyces tritici R3-111a-1]|uniref:Uncharacterized protein n=1 Tax=Gaeumannomyces tritici (strain R3-111a-1) TaxID=644352 RepID=J3P3G2_GAET3|nr:hypothetical protein GGTG_08048 [Gaeumannomyces tritici R3-111a-1]EJT74204.1 hypothetical protein GGTG_08048 [Gaeumannomyces tritici R3-111a-1]
MTEKGWCGPAPQHVRCEKPGNLASIPFKTCMADACCAASLLDSANDRRQRHARLNKNKPISDDGPPVKHDAWTVPPGQDGPYPP